MWTHDANFNAAAGAAVKASRVRAKSVYPFKLAPRLATFSFTGSHKTGWTSTLGGSGPTNHPRALPSWPIHNPDVPELGH